MANPLLQAKRDPLGDSLGPSLRMKRKSLGLTLKEVGERAGLSTGFISQVERGISVPSLSSLVAMLHVLGVDPGEFLWQPEGGDAVTHHDGRSLYAVGKDTRSYERISSTFPGNVLRSVLIHEPPGHRGELIAHDGEEMMFVVEGAITVQLENECYVLERGDSLHFLSTRTHATWNHTNRDATILWVGTMDLFGEDASMARLAHSPQCAG